MPPPLLLKFQLKISTKVFVLVITVDNESNITIIVSMIDLFILELLKKILLPFMGYVYVIGCYKIKIQLLAKRNDNF